MIGLRTYQKNKKRRIMFLWRASSNRHSTLY